MPVSEALIARDPAALMLALSRRGSDVVRYRAGTERGYLLNAPEHVAHVLGASSANYTRDTFSHRMFGAGVAEGLLTFEGAEWRREREIVEPAFRATHIAAMDATIGAAVGRLTGRWDELGESGEEIDLVREMSLLALELTVGGLFGFELGGEIDELGAAIAGAVDLLTAPEHPRFVEARRSVHELVARIIAGRASEADPPRDLLSILLETRRGDGPVGEDPVLRDRIVTFLLAGSQTTANTLAWTLHLIAEHPGAREEVEREVGSIVGERPPEIADLGRLAFTRMVAMESMRLYPAAWIIGRRAIAADEIGGVLIPSGTTVAISPYTLHRHPRYWELPDEFCPERFARGAAERRPRYAYIPFGAGARSCIGSRLALTEATLVIATLAPRYRLRPAPDRKVVPEGRILLRPRDGIWARIERAQA